MTTWCAVLALMLAACGGEPKPSKACRAARELVMDSLVLEIKNAKEPRDVPAPLERWERPEIDNSDQSFIDQAQYQLSTLQGDNMDAEIAARKAHNALALEKVPVFEKAVETLSGEASPAPAIADVTSMIEKERAISRAYVKRMEEVSASLRAHVERVDARLAGTFAGADTRRQVEKHRRILGHQVELQRLQLEMAAHDSQTFLEQTLKPLEAACRQ